MVIRTPAQITIPEHYFLKTSITIEKVGNRARAIDKYGNRIFEGDFSYVISKVFNRYGSQWKKVTILGDFTVKSRIDIPSNTKIEIIGKLTLADNVNDSMFGIAGSNIEISDGELDGNGSNQSASPSSGIRSASSIVSGIKNVVIHDIVIHDFRDQGIDLTEGEGIHIYNVTMYENGRNGIYIGYNTRKWVIENVESYSNGWLTEGYGINIGDGAKEGVVIGADLHDNIIGLGSSATEAMYYVRTYNNSGPGVRLGSAQNVLLIAIVYNNSGHGIRVFDRPVTRTDPDNITIIAIAYNNSLNGLNVEYTGATGYEHPKGIKIYGMFVKNGGHGIYLDAEDFDVEAFVANNSQHGISLPSTAKNGLLRITTINNTWSGIDIDGQDIDVLSPISRGNGGYGVKLGSNSARVRVKKPLLSGNTNGDINDQGADNIVDSKVYTVLPSTAKIGDTILYYDGTSYYLAVWNGSAWIKTTLS